jgi:hypothetical protein
MAKGHSINRLGELLPWNLRKCAALTALIREPLNPYDCVELDLATRLPSD